MKESESPQHAPRDLETGSNGGNLLKSNLKSKPQILKQDIHNHMACSQHYKMVYQCILYVFFQDIEKGFHSVPLNPFVFFFELNPSKVLADITIVDKSWKNPVIYPLVI